MWQMYDTSLQVPYWMGGELRNICLTELCLSSCCSLG